ncbi:hypothetical protein FRC01_000239 [Tulasnella sp. 417]|nr:hypothetical protein FRC01_000239 [Tulasnella sp. 417]
MDGGGFILSSHPNNQLDPPTPSSTLVEEQDEVVPVLPLSKAQERRIRDYLDAKILEINRGFKKRADPSSSLPHLHHYLTAVRPVVSVVLQIPPVDPSASLRVAFLLRVTGDMLTAIPSYPLVGPPPTPDLQPSDPPTLEVTLIELIDCIAQLDKGWVAVLASQAWDPGAGQGEGVSVTSGGPSETDKARLRSILLLGREAITDWLALGQIQLEQEIQEEFSCIFWRTLRKLGEAASISNDDINVDLDDSDEDGGN